MTAYFVINNNLIQSKYNSENTEITVTRDYSDTRFTKSSQLCNTVGFISTPIKFDELGSSIAQVKFVIKNSNPKRFIFSNKEEMLKHLRNPNYSFLYKLQVHHINENHHSITWDNFMEYGLFQKDRSGKLKLLYPEYYNLSKNDIEEVKIIDKIDEVELKTTVPDLSEIKQYVSENCFWQLTDKK